MVLLHKSKKGASLATVIVAAATLIVIATAISGLVLQWFKVVRGHEYDEYAYMASETALERGFQDISDIVTDDNYAETKGISYDPSNLKSFGDLVVSKMSGTVKNAYTDINVLIGNNTTAKLDDFQCVEANPTPKDPLLKPGDAQHVYVTIGVTAS